jgi:hypothetical protein
LRWIGKRGSEKNLSGPDPAAEIGKTHRMRNASTNTFGGAGVKIAPPFRRQLNAANRPSTTRSNRDSSSMLCFRSSSCHPVTRSSFRFI